MRLRILLCTLFVSCLTAFGQVGIGTVYPNTASMLDVTSDTSGVLLPRVQLVGLNNSAPIVTDLNGMPTSLLVYNTTAAGVTPNNVVPGFYYWDRAGSRWNKLAIDQDLIHAQPERMAIVHNSNPRLDSLMIYLDDGTYIGIPVDSLNRSTELKFDELSSKLTYLDEQGVVSSYIMPYNDSMYVQGNSLIVRDSRGSLVSVPIDSLTANSLSADSTYIMGDSIFITDGNGNNIIINLDSLNRLTTLALNSAQDTLTYVDELGVSSVLPMIHNDSLYVNGKLLSLKDSRDSILSISLDSVGVSSDSVKVERGATPDLDSMIIYDSDHNHVSIALDSLNRLTTLALNTAQDTLTYVDELGVLSVLPMIHNDSLYVNGKLLSLKDSRDSVLSISLDSVGVSSDSVKVVRGTTPNLDSMFIYDSNGNHVSVALDSLNRLTTLGLNTAQDTLTYVNELGVSSVLTMIHNDSLYVNGKLLSIRDSRDSILNVSLDSVGVSTDSVKVVRGTSSNLDSMFIYDSNGNHVSVALDSLNRLTTLGLNTAQDTLTYVNELGVSSVLPMIHNDSLYVNGKLLSIRDSRDSILNVSLDSVGVSTDSVKVVRGASRALDSMFIYDSNGNHVSVALDSLNRLTTLGLNTAQDTLTYVNELGVSSVLPMIHNDSLYVNGKLLSIRDSRDSILNVSLDSVGVSTDSVKVVRGASRALDSMFIYDSNGNHVAVPLDSLNRLTTLALNTAQDTLTYVDELGFSSALPMIHNDSLYVNGKLLSLKDSRDSILSISLDSVGVSSDSVKVVRGTSSNLDSMFIYDSNGNHVSVALDSLNRLTTLALNTAQDTLTYVDELGFSSALPMIHNDSLYVNGKLLSIRDSRDSILSISLDSVGVSNDSVSVVRGTSSDLDSMFIYDSNGNHVGVALDSINRLTTLALNTAQDTLTYLDEFGASSLLPMIHNDSLYVNGKLLSIRDSRDSILSISLDSVGVSSDSVKVVRGATPDLDSMFIYDSNGNHVAVPLDSLNRLTTLALNTAQDTLTYLDEFGASSVLPMIHNDSLYVNGKLLSLKDSRDSILSISLDSVGVSSDSVKVVRGTSSDLDSMFIYDSNGNHVGVALDSINRLTTLALNTAQDTLTYVDELGFSSALPMIHNDSLYVNGKLLSIRDSRDSILNVSLDSVGVSTDSVKVVRGASRALDSMFIYDSNGNHVGVALDSINRLTTLALNTAQDTLTYVNELGVSSVLPMIHNDSLYVNGKLLSIRDSRDSILNVSLDSVGVSTDSVKVVRGTSSNLDSMFIYDSNGNHVSVALDSLNRLTTLGLNTAQDTLTYVNELGVSSVLPMIHNDSLYVNGKLLSIRDSRDSILNVSLDSVGVSTDSVKVVRGTSSNLDSMFIYDSNGNHVGVALDSLNRLTTLGLNTAQDTLTYVNELGVSSVLPMIHNDSLYVNGKLLSIRDSRDSILNVSLDSVGVSTDSVKVVRGASRDLDSMFIYDSNGNHVSVALDSLNRLTTLGLNTAQDTLTYVNELGVSSVLPMIHNDSLYVNGKLLSIRDSRDSILNVSLDSVGVSTDSVKVVRGASRDLDSMFIYDSNGNHVSVALDSLNRLTTLGLNTAQDTLTYVNELGVSSVLPMIHNDSLYVNGKLLSIRDSRDSILNVSLDSVGVTTDSVKVVRGTSSNLDSMFIYDSNGNHVSVALDSLNRLTTLGLNTAQDTLTYVNELGVSSVLPMIHNDSLYVNGKLLSIRDSRDSILSVSLDSVGVSTDSVKVVRGATPDLDSMFIYDSNGKHVSVALDSLNRLTTLGLNTAQDTLTYVNELGVSSVLPMIHNDSLYVNGKLLSIRDSRDSILNVSLDSVGVSTDSVKVVRGATPDLDSMFIYDSNGKHVSVALDSLNRLTTLGLNTAQDTLTYVNELGVSSVLPMIHNDSLYVNGKLLSIRDSRDSILNVSLDSVGVTTDSVKVVRGASRDLDSMFIYDSNGNHVSVALDSLNRLTTLGLNTAQDTLTYVNELGVSSVLPMIHNDSLYVRGDSVLVLRDSRDSLLTIRLDSLMAKNPLYKKGTTQVATSNTDSVYIMGSLGVGTDTAKAMLDINGDLRIQNVTEGTVKDSMLVIDTLGIVKKVSQTVSISPDTLEKATRNTWYNDSTIYSKGFIYQKTDSVGVVADATFDISAFVTSNTIGTLVSIRIIDVTTNAVSTQIVDYDKLNNIFHTGSGDMYVAYPAGPYYIMLEYVK